MTPEWKLFQDLVGRIERFAAEHDATVRSPDHIADVVTGALREVDVSIRQRVGSTDVLLTVESRRHASTQDVTWIEQLATKRENIGAALTVAVSASGFSAEAVALAKRKGIATRIVTELNDDEIHQLLTPVFRIMPHIEITAFGIFIGSSDEMLGPNELPAPLRARMEHEPNNALIFMQGPGGRRMSLNDLFRWATYPHGTEAFDGAPEDGTEITRTINIPVDSGLLYLDSETVAEPVTRVGLNVKMHIVRTHVAPDIAVKYFDPGVASAIRRAEYEIQDENGAVRLHLQNDDGDPTATPVMGVQIRDKEGSLRPARLDFIRRGRLDGKPVDDPSQPSNSVRFVDP